jgi:hypothetical protein
VTGANTIRQLLKWLVRVEGRTAKVAREGKELPYQGQGFALSIHARTLCLVGLFVNESETEGKSIFPVSLPYQDCPPRPHLSAFRLLTPVSPGRAAREFCRRQPLQGPVLSGSAYHLRMARRFVTATGVQNSRKTRKQTPMLVGSPDPCQGGQMHSVSGTLASTGRTLRYAIAPQVAYPAGRASSSWATAASQCSWPSALPA